MTVGEAMALVNKRAHGVAVVVDEQNHPIGVIGPAQTEGVDRFLQVHDVMLTDLTVVDQHTEPQQVFEILDTTRHKLTIAVDDDKKLVGVMTAKGAVRCGIYKPAVDAQGRLRIGTAIGISGDAAARAEALLGRRRCAGDGHRPWTPGAHDRGPGPGASRA